MNKKEASLALIQAGAMLPLFYHDSKEVSIEIVRSLYAGGVRVVEYTNRGDQALPNFKALRKVISKEMPGLELGIGTIRTTAAAELFIAAGADFIVCPVVNKEVADVVHAHNLLWIPGCMTPTEIDTVHKKTSDQSN